MTNPTITEHAGALPQFQGARAQFRQSSDAFSREHGAEVIAVLGRDVQTARQGSEAIALIRRVTGLEPRLLGEQSTELFGGIRGRLAVCVDV
jgi:hypothetical protein